jgi:hypothetical protein
LNSRLANTPLPVASGSGSGGGSTTPTYEPGGPPPISPALPPLEMGLGNVPAVDLGKERKSGEGKWLFLIPGSVSSISSRTHQGTFWNQEHKTEHQGTYIDKVILKSTNLRYIPLLNTITPCSRQKSMHHCATLHRTVEIHTGCIFVPGSLGILADRAVYHPMRQFVRMYRNNLNLISHRPMRL